jgi:hypothetical protein
MSSAITAGMNWLAFSTGLLAIYGHQDAVNRAELGL